MSTTLPVLGKGKEKATENDPVLEETSLPSYFELKDDAKDWPSLWRSTKRRHEDDEDDGSGQKKSREESPLSKIYVDMKRTIPKNSDEARRIAAGLGMTVTELLDKEPGQIVKTVCGDTYGWRDHDPPVYHTTLNGWADSALAVVFQAWHMNQKERLLFTHTLRAFSICWEEETMTKFNSACESREAIEFFYRNKFKRYRNLKDKYETKYTKSVQISAIRPQLLDPFSGRYVDTTGDPRPFKEVIDEEGNFKTSTMAFKWYSYQRMGAILVESARQGTIPGRRFPLPVDFEYSPKVQIENPENSTPSSRATLVKHIHTDYQNSKEKEVFDGILSKIDLAGSNIVAINFPITSDLKERKIHPAISAIHTVAQIKKACDRNSRQASPGMLVHFHNPNHMYYPAEQGIRNQLFLLSGCDESSIVPVHDLQAFQEIRSTSIVFCSGQQAQYSQMPIRQILADLLPERLGDQFPPMIICKTVDMEDTEYEDEYTDDKGVKKYLPDPNHPRCQLLFRSPDEGGRYTSFPWTYKGDVPPNTTAAKNSVLGDMTVYVRNDLVKRELQVV
ncbi:hypothetical protein K491DRAFT_775472 [Lophiostoma macrostomum CBS 122681]|uniref:Uncharacterized protein n=1 Tax=Lophiostoma macrostomum CBS 122681 TaxID=1314788 RepID=A0A6A6TJC2_9PLEO|nr:hypothetical protein K491DRAFT_775472 [Lophiostoma macrostomum CBS 122681]